MPGRWGLVLSLSAAQLVSWGTLYYAFSLFVVPMEETLGWSRPTLTGALSLGLLVAGLFAFPFGVLIDRGRSRLVMPGGSLLATLLLLVWSATSSVPLFYVLWALMGIALAATLYEPAFAVLARRTGPNYRRAITAMTLVGGFASTIFLPLTQFFIDAVGWRDTLLVLAAFNLIVGAGVHFVVLAPKHEAADSAAFRPPALRPGYLAAVLKRPAFRALILAFAGYNIVLAALTFHVVPLLLERGLDMTTIVAAVSLFGPMQVAGRLLLMFGGERWSAVTIGIVSFVLLAAALLVLILMPVGTGAAFAFSMLFGAANGMHTIVRAMIVPELFSAEGYGSLSGALAASASFAKALAPFAAAALWQASGGYGPVLGVALALVVLSSAAFLLAGRLAAR